MTAKLPRQWFLKISFLLCLVTLLRYSATTSSASTQQTGVLPSFGPFVLSSSSTTARTSSVKGTASDGNATRTKGREADEVRALLNGSPPSATSSIDAISSKIPVEYRNILEAAGPAWLWFVETHFDGLKLYPWKGFEMKEGPALAFASVEQGKRIAYVATDMPAFQVAQNMVHEAGHFHALCERLDFSNQDYARQFERAFVRDYENHRIKH